MRIAAILCAETLYGCQSPETDSICMLNFFTITRAQVLQQNCRLQPLVMSFRR